MVVTIEGEISLSRVSPSARVGHRNQADAFVHGEVSEEGFLVAVDCGDVWYRSLGFRGGGGFFKIQNWFPHGEGYI